MLGYELYLYDPINGYQLLGVLPERRRNPKRITKQSVLNWAEKYFGTDLNLKEMFLLEVKTSDLRRAKQGLDRPADTDSLG